MATIFSHPAVALGLFPWFKPVRKTKYVLLTGAILTVLPDADVIGLHLGIAYGDLWGHRGMTHSIFFAMAFCAILSFAFRAQLQQAGQKIAAFPIWLYFTICMASHGALDAMTTGGLGVAFFAPFNNERYFFSWRPIKVSTLNIAHFFQGQGIGVLKSELLYIWPAAIAVFILGFALVRKSRK